MDIFNNLKEYQLLELQEDLKTIFMIKNNNYIRDLDNEEKKNGLSFISNRQRRKEGTLCASGVGGDRTHAGPPQRSRVCQP